MAGPDDRMPLTSRVSPKRRVASWARTRSAKVRVWGCLARADFTLCQQLDFIFKTRTRSPLADCRAPLSLGYSLATAVSPVVLIAISALRSATSLSSLPYFYPRQPSNSSQKAPLQSLSGRCLRSPTITSRFTHCFKPQPESSRFAASSNWRLTSAHISSMALLALPLL